MRKQSDTMAFDNLSDRLQMSLRRITGKGRITEKDIEEMMREVRLSLLEADVNFKVVKSFTKEVKEEIKYFGFEQLEKNTMVTPTERCN